MIVTLFMVGDRILMVVFGTILVVINLVVTQQIAYLEDHLNCDRRSTEWP